MFVGKFVELDVYRRISLADRKFLHDAVAAYMKAMYSNEQVTPEE